jgi:cytoskeletal protein CcmA (bactofilin family)
MNTIGPYVHIVGEVRSDEDLLVEGRIEGHIHVGDAALTIGPPATIHADVRGRTITIRGDVRGTISAAERIELAASASVNGYLTANHVIIVEGARFNGRIDMGRRAIAATVARYRAEQELKRQ